MKYDTQKLKRIRGRKIEELDLRYVRCVCVEKATAWASIFKVF